LRGPLSKRGGSSVAISLDRVILPRRLVLYEYNFSII
jgi:hypothetical protein